MSKVIIGLVIAIILIILICLVFCGKSEKMVVPVLKVRFQVIPDLLTVERYDKFVTTIYSDMSSSKMIVGGDGTVLVTKNFPPNSNKWWAASRIMNFPFEKINPCPAGPTNYILEFSNRVISVGCVPIHVFNDLELLTSDF